MRGMVKRYPHTGRPKTAYAIKAPRVVRGRGAALVTAGAGHERSGGYRPPALLLPGFMGSEATLIALGAVPSATTYAVETWGLGRNISFPRAARHRAGTEDPLPPGNETGRRVSLVGWSLGGVFAMLARTVRRNACGQHNTLGSPISPILGRRRAAAGESDVPADRPARWLGRPLCSRAPDRASQDALPVPG